MSCFYDRTTIHGGMASRRTNRLQWDQHSGQLEKVLIVTDVTPSWAFPAKHNRTLLQLGYLPKHLKKAEQEEQCPSRF